MSTHDYQKKYRKLSFSKNFLSFLSIFFGPFFINFALNQDQNFWWLFTANFIIYYKITLAIYAIFKKIKNLKKFEKIF